MKLFNDQWDHDKITKFVCNYVQLLYYPVLLIYDHVNQFI